MTCTSLSLRFSMFDLIKTIPIYYLEYFFLQNDYFLTCLLPSPNCLFVFFLSFENFSLIWRRHHCRCRAANFDLCSALMDIQQWVFNYRNNHQLQQVQDDILFSITIYRDICLVFTELKCFKFWHFASVAIRQETRRKNRLKETQLHLECTYKSKFQ